MILLSQVLSDNILKNLDEGMVRSWLETELPKILSFFWSVVLAFIIYAIGVKVIKLIRRGFCKAMDRRDAEEGVRQFLDQIIKWLLYAVLFIVILRMFGITTTSVAAAVGTLGVTAGLALQGSLSNLAGGVLILLLHPFRVGDYIIEDTHKNEGEVVEISVFYTKLKTVDNKIIVVPNGTLANNSMTNVTTSDRRLINLIIPIGYDADIKEAKEVLLQLVEDEELRLPNEEVKVFVSELADSSVNLGLRFWVATENYWPVRWKTVENVKYALDEHGISIPYQQIDINVKK